MTKTSTVVWTLIGTVIAVLGILGLIYGPGMIRQGKALVGPIVDIAQSENRLADLNIEIPFDKPADGTISDDRFAVFLDIRRELRTHYLEWQTVEQQLEKQEQEDWESAMVVLKAIQGVTTVQIETLRSHGMSPAEFIWIEDLAYATWAPQVEDLIRETSAAEVLRATTVADLQTLADLQSRYGASRATKEFADRLNARLDSLDDPAAPAVEGVAEATSEMFWAHRQELVDLDLAKVSKLHDIMRGNNNVEIKIDGSTD